MNRHKPKLGTHHINKFFESAVFLEFAALGDVLDVVSPYNGKLPLYIFFLKNIIN